jgi:hypothetical protein
LNAVELKRVTILPKSSEEPNNIHPIAKTINKREWVLKKSMKVPFSKIQFLNACVTFTVFIEELSHDVVFEIEIRIFDPSLKRSKTTL